MTPNLLAQMQDRTPEASAEQLIQDLMEANGIMLRTLKRIAVYEGTPPKDYAKAAIKAASYIYPA